MLFRSGIDHVFVSNKFQVNQYGILTNGYWTEGNSREVSKEGVAPRELNFRQYVHRLPSDHYPVMVKLEYRKRAVIYRTTLYRTAKKIKARRA